MKKKIFAVLITAVLSISLMACGSDKSKNNEASNDQVNVEENLFSVGLTVPADFVGETTQEDLDQTANEKGYKSITLNDDGSATYIMTKAQHKELLSEIETNINSELNAMIGSEDYPNFVKIEANSDFTKFTITTSSTSLDLNESFSTMIFYMYGGMYNVFSGNDVDNIHVDFVNADSGEIISSADSSDLSNTSSESSSDANFSDSDNVINFEASSFAVNYTRHEVGTDWDGNPCLYYYFNFTNNGEETTSATASSYIQCFQNGIECDIAFVDYNAEMDNYSKDIQPGITLEVCTAFSLTDSSEVTLEASDWASFSNDKDVQKITLE